MRIALYVGLTALLVGIAGVSAAGAQAAKISINVKDADAQAVFAQIARQAGVRVTVAEGVQGTISLQADDATARDLLDAAAVAVRARCVAVGDGYRIEPLPPADRATAAMNLVTEPEPQPVRPAGTVSAPTGGGGAPATAAPEAQRTEAIQLRYADARAIAQALGGLVIGGSGSGMMNQGGWGNGGWGNQGGWGNGGWDNQGGWGNSGWGNNSGWNSGGNFGHRSYPSGSRSRGNGAWGGSYGGYGGYSYGGGY